MHDEVGAELERTLVGRRRERVVDRHKRVLAPGDDAFDVDNVEQRVGRALDPDQPRVVGHGALHGIKVGLVDEVERQAPAAQHLVDQPERAAVQVRRHHDVRSRLAQHGDQRVLGGQARRVTRPPGRLRARPAPARAPRESGWPSARSRSRRRTRRARAARRSRSGGWPGSPSRTTGPGSGPRARPGSRTRRAARSVSLTKPMLPASRRA